MDTEPHPAPVRPLAAFAVPNFRRFVAGQTISLAGSWTEKVAQAILVLQLTHSGVWLGRPRQRDTRLCCCSRRTRGWSSIGKPSAGCCCSPSHRSPPSRSCLARSCNPVDGRRVRWWIPVERCGSSAVRAVPEPGRNGATLEEIDGISAMIGRAQEQYPGHPQGDPQRTSLRQARELLYGPEILGSRSVAAPATGSPSWSTSEMRAGSISTSGSCSGSPSTSTRSASLPRSMVPT
jgi:hypothetical protein